MHDIFVVFINHYQMNGRRINYGQTNYRGIYGYIQDAKKTLIDNSRLGLTKKVLKTTQELLRETL